MGIGGIENLVGNSGNTEPEVLTIVSNVGTYQVTPPSTGNSAFACDPDESGGLEGGSPSAPGDVNSDGDLI